ncbi:MAG: AsmA family protein [Roseiarcus sp.]|jgi:AsmA protein
MRSRAIWAAATCVALLALPAGFHQWPISSAAVVERTRASLAHSLGLELRRPARVRLSLLPWPALQMVDVEVRGQDMEPILTAPEASVRLALLPLLMGRFEPASARLRQPTILVDLDTRPFASGSAIAATMRARTAVADPAPLGALELQGGLLRIVSAAGGIDTIVEDVEGTLNWPSLDSPLRIDAHATWRDERLAVAARLGAPADLLNGGRSDGALSVASRNAHFEFRGEVSAGPARFEGSVSAEILSTSALRRLLGVSIASDLSDGRIGVSGQLATNAQMVTLSAMRLNLLDQSLEGALAFTGSAKRLAVSGSLAAELLDLEPGIARAAAELSGDRGWSAAPFSLTPLGALDFDLRISAAQVKWRGRPLADAAIELVGKDGRLTATLAEATVYGGILKAEVALAPAPAGVRAHASASLANADIGALCGDFGWSSYSGQGGGEFAFDSVGDSLATFAEALEGKATIQLAAGIVDGLSFEEALRRSERRPIDVFNDMRMGRTVFARAVASLAVARGGRGLINATLTGAGVDVDLSGAVDVLARQVSARATAIQTDERGAPAPQGPELEFEIDGPWSAPAIKPFVGGG